MVAGVTAWALLAQVPSIAGLAPARTLLKPVAAGRVAPEAVPDVGAAAPSSVSAQVEWEVAAALRPRLSAGRVRSAPAQPAARCSTACTILLLQRCRRSPSDHRRRYPVESFRVAIAALQRTSIASRRAFSRSGCPRAASRIAWRAPFDRSRAGFFVRLHRPGPGAGHRDVHRHRRFDAPRR
jgi:hypothetical protein